MRQMLVLHGQTLYVQGDVKVVTAAWAKILNEHMYKRYKSLL